MTSAGRSPTGFWNIKKSLWQKAQITNSYSVVAKYDDLHYPIPPISSLIIFVHFIKSNLFENINEKFDMIISNPPYIKTDVIDTLSNEVKNEPRLALDGKEDGLYFYKEIIKNAKGFLNPNGRLLFEIGFDQKESVTKLFEEAEYINVYSKKDLAGLDRIVSGEKKGE